MRVRIAETSAEDFAKRYHDPGKCIDAKQHAKSVKDMGAFVEVATASTLDELKKEHAQYVLNEDAFRNDVKFENRDLKGKVDERDKIV